MQPAVTQLTLIRHGESEAQTRQIVSGHDTCTGLSDLGRHQAEALRDRLLRTGELGAVDVLYTSILARSVETAAILQPALGVDASAECDWCEIHAGEAEGMQWDEVRERFFVLSDRQDPFARRIPGAETWAELCVRVGARLQRVARDHAGQRVVVVGHGGTVGASFVALGDLPVGRVASLTRETVNTSLTRWQCRDGEWTLLGYNDAAHLAGGLPA